MHLLFNGTAFCSSLPSNDFKPWKYCSSENKIHHEIQSALQGTRQPGKQQEYILYKNVVN